MDQGLSETLETLQRQIGNLRDDLHGRIDLLVESHGALERRAAQHDRAHECASSLRKQTEARLGARIDDLNSAFGLASEGLSRRLSEIEVRLACTPGDGGNFVVAGVYSGAGIAQAA